MRLHLFDHGHRPHLLIVSGSALFAEALSQAASPARFETATATSRAEALKARGGQDFAGYVVDANLPDATGAELVRDLRDARVTAPILLIESLAEAALAKHDADAAITKPVSLPDFRRLLQELFLANDPALSAQDSSRRKISSFHLSTLIIPVLLGAGIALTCWLLSLS